MPSPRFDYAKIRKEVREWALQNGWSTNERSPYLFRESEGKRFRLHFGEKNLKEQEWVERYYTPATRGYWRSIRSCPWVNITITNEGLDMPKNVAGGAYGVFR